ncbi:TrmH family RNA methyltransferase [Guggenheimella bovis]
MKSIKELELIARKREKSGYFVIEGENGVSQLKDFGVSFDGFSSKEAPVEGTTAIDPKLFKRLTNTVTPQKVLAVLPVLEEKPFSDGPVLVLDRIQDPGNLGTLLRTAVSFGLENVLLLKGTVSIYNDKVLRSSLGSILKLRIHERSSIEELEGYELLSANLEGKPFREVEVKKNFALVLGNEANGVHPEIQKISKSVTIPMASQMESLNVAVAGAIILESFLHNLRNQ